MLKSDTGSRQYAGLAIEPIETPACGLPGESGSDLFLFGDSGGVSRYSLPSVTARDASLTLRSATPDNHIESNLRMTLHSHQHK